MSVTWSSSMYASTRFTPIITSVAHMESSLSESQRAFSLSSLGFVTQSFTSMAGKNNSSLAAVSLISCGMYLDSGFVVLSTIWQLSILVVHNLSLRAFVHPQGRIATVVVVSFVVAICTRHGEHLLGKAPPILWKDLTFQPVVLQISWIARSDTATLDHAKMQIKSSKSSWAHKRADVTVKSGPVRCSRRHRWGSLATFVVARVWMACAAWVSWVSVQDVPWCGAADGLSRFEHELFMSFLGRALEHGAISSARLIIKFSISTHSNNHWQWK